MRVNLRRIYGKIDVLRGKERVEYIICYKEGKVSVKTLLKTGKSEKLRGKNVKEVKVSNV